MQIFHVHGYGRDTKRKRSRKYYAQDEAAALRHAEEDGTVVENITVIGNTDEEDKSRYLKRVLRDLGALGAEEKHFEHVASILKKRSGKVPSPKLIAWHIYKSILARHEDFGARAQIYNVMAGFLRDQGSDPFPALQNLAKMQIMSWKQSGIIAGVSVLAAAGCCKVCKAHDGLRMSLEKALANPPVPCKGCTTRIISDEDPYTWCRCTLSPILIDEW